MGKKYLNTKDGTLEDSILSVWQNAAEELDPVNKKAVKKKSTIYNETFHSIDYVSLYSLLIKR